jgi:antitoxin component YwqK of YwqJK toxin-antitoxin module
MSNILHDAYVALLSGVTSKIGNEIHWYDQWNNPLTIEPVNIDKYILRYYYPNMNKSSEYKYENGLLNGKSILWNKNGSKCWEIEYRNGQFHGKVIRWIKEQKYEEKYWNGKRIK